MIARRRLLAQHLTRPELDAPVDLVAWMGAVQAQDYAGAKWALGLRLAGATDAGIEQAVAEGSILRTHPLRGTLHFVAAADIRWILGLTASRQIARATPRWRQLGLDEATFTKSARLMERALRGGRQLDRRALGAALERGGVSTRAERLVHLMMRAELDLVVCSGARQGKQSTFALLDERVPPAPARDRDDAVAELARRYFRSHGPATVEDFVWWSGLTVGDARSALEAIASELTRRTVDGVAYWSSGEARGQASSRSAYLLPPFDELTVAYRRREMLCHPEVDPGMGGPGGMLQPVVVIDGAIVGRWKRTLGPTTVTVVVQPWRALSPSDLRAVEKASERYGAFLDRQVEVRVERPSS